MSGFRTTAPAQLSATGLPCIRPCSITDYQVNWDLPMASRSEKLRLKILYHTARKLPSSTQTFARISLKKVSFRPISPLLLRPLLYEKIIYRALVWVNDVVESKNLNSYSLVTKKTKSRSSRPARFFQPFLLATLFCMTIFHAWKVSDQFKWVCITVSVQLRVCECIYKMRL